MVKKQKAVNADPIFQGFLEVDESDFFFLENTIPRIINMIPIAIDVRFFDEPKILGNKKRTPASTQSIGANLCNIALLLSGGFIISSFRPQLLAE